MSYVGDYALGSTFYFPFETLYNNTLTSLVGGALAVYADDNVVQFSTGLTLSADFDGIVGEHEVKVIATSGNGFASGVNYTVRLSAGTVGGLSAVGRIVGEFSIEKVSALRPATAGRTLVVDAAGLADANMVKMGPTGAGTAQTARDVGATLGVAGAGLTALGDTRLANLDAAVSSRSTFAGGAVASVTGNVGGNVVGSVGSVTGNVGGNVVGSVASVAAAVTITGDLSATMKTSVKTQVTDALAVDTYGEPAAVPAATASLKDKLGYLFTKARNKTTQTATTQLLRNDTDAGTIATTAVSDDGTTFTKGKDA